MNRRLHGFTLIELLVALSVMALMAILGWRGVDGMARTQAQTQARSDELLALQTGLAQWSVDLDAVTQLAGVSAIDYDGRVLRLTRRGSGDAGDGILVVAWTRRSMEGSGQWLRWQSPPLTTRGDLQLAWQKAGQWAQNPGDEEKLREVAVTPLDDWQIFFYRSDAWTNPQSSDATTQASTAAPAAASAAALAQAGISLIPEGVRVVLTLPPGRALSGRLTRDWVRPTVGGGKS